MEEGRAWRLASVHASLPRSHRRSCRRHGNLLALQAVLADLREAAPDLVVNVGDLVSGSFDPAGAADAQMALACPTLAGNHERQVLAGGDTGSSDAFARPRLSCAHMGWLAALPATLTGAGGGNASSFDRVTRRLLSSWRRIEGQGPWRSRTTPSMSQAWIGARLSKWGTRAFVPGVVPVIWG